MATSIDWPAALPCFRFEPYSVAPRPGAIEMTLGMLTHRAMVYTQNNEVVSVEAILGSAQEQALRTFFKTTTAMGTQWFMAPILRAGVYGDVEVMFFGEPPRFTPVSDTRVRATFTLLTRGEQLIPGPEPEYVLTANQAVNIAAPEFAEAPTFPSSPGGTVVTINTLSTDLLVIEKPTIASDGALDWDAWSAWPTNVGNGDNVAWMNHYIVSNQADVVVRNYDSGRSSSISGAYALAAADHPAQLTGHTQYQFWGWDIDTSDNRRGISYRVKTYSLVV